MAGKGDLANLHFMKEKNHISLRVFGLWQEVIRKLLCYFVKDTPRFKLRKNPIKIALSLKFRGSSRSHKKEKVTA